MLIYLLTYYFKQIYRYNNHFIFIVGTITMLSLSEHDKAVLNCVFNPHLPLESANEPEFPEELQDEEIELTPQIQQAKALEVEAVSKAESGNFREALELLKTAIRLAPDYASLYNNRAQVFRLKGDNLDAFKDLTTAIELSKSQGRTGCQALCQRGLLHRKAGRNELAKDDFSAAAKLGSPFAKSQLVEMNPYAALCNQMLNEVFKSQFAAENGDQVSHL